MLIAGVCLWAQEASARPRWVRGTWRVDDGVIRRVSERYEDGARRVPFLVPSTITKLGDFASGLAPAKIGDKWGFIDHAGTIVIAPAYDAAGTF